VKISVTLMLSLVLVQYNTENTLPDIVILEEDNLTSTKYPKKYQSILYPITEFRFLSGGTA
jgi:hypothetical protein